MRVHFFEPNRAHPQKGSLILGATMDATQSCAAAAAFL